MKTLEDPKYPTLLFVQHGLQSTAKWLLASLALAMLVTTLLSAFGQLPWLSLAMSIEAGADVQIGQYVQITATLFLLSLLAFLPAVNRMLALERDHRKFSLSMEDVAQAYQLSHHADREGRFALSSEFDSVRERFQTLREHPDLSRLEPEILELAAQMSHTTRDLAATYSERKVSRAKEFLKERQTELQEFADKVAMAQSVTDELRRWKLDVDRSEAQVNVQLDRLEADLKEILPLIGYEMDTVDAVSSESPSESPALSQVQLDNQAQLDNIVQIKTAPHSFDVTP